MSSLYEVLSAGIEVLRTQDDVPRTLSFAFSAMLLYRNGRRASYVDEVPSASFPVLGISYEVLRCLSKRLERSALELTVRFRTAANLSIRAQYGIPPLLRTLR